jgi:ABC-type multidrug transport system fused ATPase/permease subunit
MDVVDALPDGLATDLPERGRSLSGGQRQRLALARSLVADPDVLILDEPTSAVDAHTEARIGQRLREARAGRTTVVFTTSPLLLDHVDTVVFLAAGQVRATGHHRQLLRDNAEYRSTVTRGQDS